MTPAEDPYAIRARTHRSDGHPSDPRCKRCQRLWPCRKAHTVDQARRWPKRFLMLVGAVLAVAVVAAASVAGFVFGAIR